MKAFRYSGLLNRPMPAPTPINAFNVGGPIDQKKVRAEFWLRLDALFVSCDVEPKGPDMWIDLALALAERHVPGFSYETTNQTARQQARSRKEMKILVEMLRLIRNGKSERNAADIVAKKLNRTGGHRKPLSADAVARAYRRMKRDGD